MCGKRFPLLSGLRNVVPMLLAMSMAVLLAPRSAQADNLASALVRAAPAANPRVIRLAVAAMGCATAHGMESSQRLGVIDYSLPSSKPRLWVFDLKRRVLLYRELVAHGRNSGLTYAKSFSNRPGSLESSLGLFRTASTYQGNNGYSLRMDGLEPGFNDNARERAIVMHGAPYVSKTFAREEGRVGRSWGCPAVREGVAKRLIDSMKGGQFLFSYYPDRHWLQASRYLHCTGGSQLAQSGEPGRGGS